LNKKLLIILLTFPLLLIHSQEFDEAYLDSLPADVRDDVLAKMELQNEIEEPVYRRASTAIDKEETEDENKTYLFGSKFFDTVQSSFMPTNEPNLDSSYILDFGDVLEIQLIGQEDYIESFTIGRNGSINIPDIGLVMLSGLSMSDASSMIKAKINNAYIGTDAFISLKNIRDISVLIAGNAFNPGIYTLNGNSNMLHALSMAGGVSEIGSYRNISLIRNGNVIDNLDIYDVLIYGKYNFASGLRSGDSIVVNPINSVIAIESGVRRKGLYELKDNENFSNLIDFASGYNKIADLSNISVKRFINGKGSIIRLNKKDLETFKFIDNDSIFIREYKFNAVKIEGAVRNPGTYNLAIGTTLGELIESSGGYESSAYPFGGYLDNLNAKEINKISKDRLYDKFIESMIANSSVASAENPSAGLYLQQIKEVDVTGRIIAEFDLDIIKSNPSSDTILEDGDTILIPYITQQVYIQGDISNPGAVRYSPNQDIDFYIKSAGGLLKTADKNNIFIIHPNGETMNLSGTRLSFLLKDRDYQLIYPGLN
jgi:protein involved in polysaccharide export with SLBB domain